MKTWVDRLLLIALTLFVVLLTLTALPSLFYGHLGGTMLLAHMLVSGAFVFLLPVFALLWTWRHISRFTSGTLQRIGFWAVIFTGFSDDRDGFCLYVAVSVDGANATAHSLARLRRVCDRPSAGIAALGHTAVATHGGDSIRNARVKPRGVARFN